MMVEVILYNYRKNKSGVYPLYIRVTKNRKQIYRATGLKVRERDWNRRRREPTASCPNRRRNYVAYRNDKEKSNRRYD